MIFKNSRLAISEQSDQRIGKALLFLMRCALIPTGINFFFRNISLNAFPVRQPTSSQIFPGERELLKSSPVNSAYRARSRSCSQVGRDCSFMITFSRALYLRQMPWLFELLIFCLWQLNKEWVFGCIKPAEE